MTSTNKNIGKVKRQETITEEVVKSGFKALLNKGKTNVTIRPTMEIVGLKYGERAKTRTLARKLEKVKSKGPVVKGKAPSKK